MKVDFESDKNVREFYALTQTMLNEHTQNIIDSLTDNANSTCSRQNNARQCLTEQKIRLAQAHTFGCCAWIYMLINLLRRAIEM